MIDDGFKLLAERFNPILDVFGECGVKFALEVHPTEIAFDLYTAQRAIEALDGREEFGFNFDPSHLMWQGIDPVEFIRAFPERIYHVHMKDAIVTLNGRSGILASHLSFGDPRRGWDFRSLGRGGVNFEEIIRALNAAGYAGPLVGRMGRQRHGPRAWRQGGLRVRQASSTSSPAAWPSTPRSTRPNRRKGGCRAAAERQYAIAWGISEAKGENPRVPEGGISLSCASARRWNSSMMQFFTLEYWMDGGWYVGRLKGVPGVFSQGETLEELEENVRDAYRMMVEE